MNKKEDHSCLFVIIGVIAGALGLLILGISLYCFLAKTRKQTKEKEKEIMRQKIENTSPELLCKQMENQA